MKKITRRTSTTSKKKTSKASPKKRQTKAKAKSKKKVVRKAPKRSSRPKPVKARKPARPVSKKAVRKASRPAKSAKSAKAHARDLTRLPVLRTPLQAPLPQQHVAPVMPAVVAPARSMPPREDVIVAAPGSRPSSALPTEFDIGGVILVISYSIRDGRRADFLNLISDLKPLLISIGGTDFTLFEDRSRMNYFMEIFKFRDEAEFTAFDDKFHKDRKIAAIYGLLDEIVEAEKSDFKIFDRRL